jgi:anti-sigma regulatory factor (Ser/Thr protein kinase)
MTGRPDDGTCTTRIPAVCLPVTGAASTVRAPADAVAGLPERDSGAGRAFHPDRDKPRHTVLELAAMPSAVPCARLHARHVVAEWEMPTIAETVELLVSELITNAITEAVRISKPDASVVSMRLTAGIGAVLVEVHDSSPRLPEPRNAQTDTEHGRGLMLVGMISARWGVCPLPGHGKIVWCIASQ